MYDLDESHLEASSIREEEWIIRGPQTNQSLGSGSQERLLEFSSWALPQTQGSRVPEGVFLTASPGDCDIVSLLGHQSLLGSSGFDDLLQTVQSMK